MTLVKLKTWWRIQKRMAGFYFAEYFFYVEWPFMIIVNWLFLLTMPLWVGIIYGVSYISRAKASKKNVERSVLTGKIWFWNSYDTY